VHSLAVLNEMKNWKNLLAFFYMEFFISTTFRSSVKIAFAKILFGS